MDYQKNHKEIHEFFFFDQKKRYMSLSTIFKEKKMMNEEFVVKVWVDILILFFGKKEVKNNVRMLEDSFCGKSRLKK